MYEVIIAGAGPVGLLLACELRLAGISVLALERNASPQSSLKAAPLGFRALNTLSIETLYRRGLMADVCDLTGRPPQFTKTTGFLPGGHFAGLKMNSNKLDLSRWKYKINGPSLQPGITSMERIETALTRRAISLGVEIRRGAGISSILSQGTDSITVETDDHQQFTSRWLVGCDGGRSQVRKSAGIEMIGTEPQLTCYILHCELNPPNALKPGSNPTANGVYVSGPGPNCLYLADFDGGAYDRTKEVTRDHAQKMLNKIVGRDDIEITKLNAASSWTDRSKIASTYRKGRVLLAGDAAHIHPPIGSQGLNAGIGDAINLGWKLATVIKQEKNGSEDTSLLDTYESERRPFAEWVLDWGRQQIAALQPNLHGVALRKMVQELMQTDGGMNYFLDRYWGLFQRYQLGNTEDDEHPAIGYSAPDFELEDGSRLGPRLEEGKGMLVVMENDEVLRQRLLESGLEQAVVYLRATVKDSCGLSAMLIRPDGIVAWITEKGQIPNLDALETAFGRWFPGSKE